MRLVANRQALLRALSFAADVTDRKSPNFAASCVLIEATSDDSVLLSATDLATSVRVREKASVGDWDKSFALPAKELVERLKAISEESVDLRIGDDLKAILKAGKRTYTMRALPGVEYPRFPEIPNSKVYPLPAGTLAMLLAKSKHSMNEDPDGKFHGTQLRLRDGVLRVDASDGKTGSTLSVPLDTPGTFQCLIPFRSVNVIRGVAEKLGALDELSFAIAGSMLIVMGTDLEIATPLLGYMMPDLDGVLKPPSTFFTVDKGPFISAVRGVSLNAGAVQRAVDITAADGVVKVSASNDTGDATDEVSCECTGAFEVRVVFSMLLDCIEATEGDRVKIGCDGGVQPAFVEPIVEVEGVRRQVVMPSMKEGYK